MNATKLADLDAVESKSPREAMALMFLVLHWERARLTARLAATPRSDIFSYIAAQDALIAVNWLVIAAHDTLLGVELERLGIRVTP